MVENYPSWKKIERKNPLFRELNKYRLINLRVEIMAAENNAADDPNRKNLYYYLICYLLDNNISGLMLLDLTLVVQSLGIIINCLCNPYFLKQCHSDITETQPSLCVSLFCISDSNMVSRA
jgi:hypothetical protein